MSPDSLKKNYDAAHREMDKPRIGVSFYFDARADHEEFAAHEFGPDGSVLGVAQYNRTGDVKVVDGEQRLIDAGLAVIEGLRGRIKKQAAGKTIEAKAAG